MISKPDTASRALPAALARYCRRCGYDLRATSNDAPRCPECGRAFDPQDLRSIRRRPLRRWLRRVKHAAFVLAALLLLLGATWGWFYWGWLDEQRALRELGVNEGTAYGSAPLYPQLRDRLGLAGFVLDRMTTLHLLRRRDITDLRPVGRLQHLTVLYASGVGASDLASLSRLTKLRTLDLQHAPVSDLRPLAALKHLEDLLICDTRVSDITPLSGLLELRTLDASDTPVSDLQPLSRLAQLEFLILARTSVRDLSPLARLTSLVVLSLDGTQVNDVTPLGGMRALGQLWLNDTGVSDLSPLRGLPTLRDLYVRRTPVADLSPLKAIPGLRFLSVPATLTEDQLAALQAALPQCHIDEP